MTSFEFDEIAETAAAKPTIILVHGGFSDGSIWNQVRERLTSRGFTVMIAAPPLRDPQSDAISLAALMRTVDGQVVLVGHSYGGVIISNACRLVANVASLVFVAGLAPVADESVSHLLGLFPGSALPEALTPAPRLDGGVDFYVRQDLYGEVFAAGAAPGVIANMAMSQRPVAAEVLNEPSRQPMWHEYPCWFIFGEADRSLPPDLHHFLAQRAGAVEAVAAPGAPHALPITHPEPVAELIVRAAEAIRPPVPNLDP